MFNRNSCLDAYCEQAVGDSFKEKCPKCIRKKPLWELRFKMGSYSSLVKAGIGITAELILLFEPSPSFKDHGNATFSEELVSELDQIKV